ncbi:MAG: TonB-dependent receptor, partial [Bacteroidota bacterium]
VEAGETTTLDFVLALAPVAGEEVLVLGLRAQGQARALTQQQNAANIVNVIAADQIGRFPDATAPEALQRVPGIGVQRDQGEGRFIQIRGAAPQFTTVTFNGERIPSPEGDVRQIALDAIPSELLEAIEVSKAITPDMDADAIGGSVNLVTRRAPATPLLAADVAGGFSALRSEGAVRGSVTGGQRFAEGRLGVLGSFSINRRNFASDDLEPEWDFGDDGVPLGGDDGLEEVQARYYDLVRQRIGANLALDYDLAPGQSLFLRSVFTQLQDTEQRRRMRFKVGDEELGYEHKNRTEFLRTFNLAAGGDHTFASGITLDYQVTYAISGEDTPEDIEIAFEQGDVAYDVDLSDPSEPNLGVSMDAVNNISAFEFDSIEPAESFTSNADYVAAVNLGIPYRFGESSGTVQFGGKFRLKDKTQNVTESAFEFDDFDLVLGGDGVNTPFNDVFGDAFGDGFDYEPGDYPLPSTITSDDQVLDFIDRYNDLLEADGDAPIEGDLEDFDATETNFAAYVMTELNITDRLLVLPGVRYEFTDLEATGNTTVVEFDAEEEEFVLTGTASATETNNYGYFFPMLHVRYRATPRTNIRAAVTTALARPNFFDLAPYRIQDDTDVQIGNPALDPSRSVNLDLLVEHFTESIGVFSGGVFYKSISDPIVSVLFEEVLEGESLDVIQSRNGESGYIFGVEVAAQQQFRFLPGALSGLGLYANYTYTDSEAKLADGTTGVFPGQAAHLFNVALSYERAGFSGQVSLNYTGEFLDEFAGDGVGADRASDIFVEDRYGLDFSATYQATPQVTIFAEAVNLLNEPLVLYQGVESRPIQREFYQPSGWIGVRLNY